MDEALLEKTKALVKLRSLWISLVVIGAVTLVVGIVLEITDRHGAGGGGGILFFLTPYIGFPLAIGWMGLDMWKRDRRLLQALEEQKAAAEAPFRARL